MMVMKTRLDFFFFLFCVFLREKKKTQAIEELYYTKSLTLQLLSGDFLISSFPILLNEINS